MINILNKIFGFLKVLLLIASFGLTLYILIHMYYYLEKEPFGEHFFEFIANLIPFAIMLILFVVNFVGKQKVVNQNIFYNITCVLALATVVFMGYRALFDQNMVLWFKTDYHINFEYFADQLFQIKAMIYALCAIDVFLIIENVLSKKKTLDVLD